MLTPGSFPRPACAAVLCGLAVTVPAVRATELPSLSETNAPFTFVVLGDTHYERPDFAKATLIHAIAADLRDIPPLAFVIQTGDLVEGGAYAVVDGKTQFHLSDYAGMKTELTFAMRDLADSFRVPVFIAVGSHDQHDPGHKAYDEIVRPVLSRQLGMPLSRPFYAFRYGNSCFLVLDQVPADYAEQARFADDMLAKADGLPGVEHVFLFCHGALREVFRAGFDNPPLTESLMPALRKRAPDAWFCGHTHNTVACVCDVEGIRITQIQGVVNHSESPLVPIEQRRAPLLPAAALPYVWGYVEGRGPRAACYVVTVRGKTVNVQLRAAGQGVIREFEWTERGKLHDLKVPAPTATMRVTVEILKQATAARLCFCPSVSERTAVSLLLNGELIAEAQIAPVYCPLWEERTIPIPKEKLGLLRPANEVRIGNLAKAFFAVANARLEVTLADGRTVCTSVSDHIYFACTQAEALASNMGHSVLESWQVAPPHMVQTVHLGEPLGPATLVFPSGSQ